jgi:hypothetical protein
MSSTPKHLRMVIAIATSGVALLVVGIVAFRSGPGDAKPSLPKAPAVEQITEPTAKALARILDSKLSAQERDSSLGDVKRELTTDEVEQVRELVKDRKLNLAFRNDVLVLLERQKRKPEWLGPELVRMWNDNEEHDTWRDYALQHMEPAYDYATNRAEIESILTKTARGGGRVSGTALLSLERLGKRYPALAEKAKAIARDTVKAEKRDDEAAVTAMQVARAAGDKSVLDTARSLAADKSAIVRLRMSSIGTLGELGAEADLQLLERLVSDPEKRVKRVAKYNLARLKKKLQQ